jgi:hypothetical protein
MRKFLLILITLFLSINLLSYADEDWSSYDNIDNAWDGQKSITNKQFEETMDALQAKKKQKERKQREKAIKKVKGTSLIPQHDAHQDEISAPDPVEEFEDGELISIPVDFIYDGKQIDRGFYKIKGEKKDNKVYILLYQAHTLVAKLTATETDDDFNEPAIQFTKLKTINDNTIKIIYGCIDFNAYVNIHYEEPKPLF